jgi:putative PIN family toxin of toxin-antitoxin system
LIVFDVSTLIGAAIIRGSVPRRAVDRAIAQDRIALSAAVHAELITVLDRPRLARFIDPALRDELLASLIATAIWFDPIEQVRECRDAKDDKYLELALAANASIIVSSDNDLLVMHPWRGIQIVKAAEYLASGSR